MIVPPGAASDVLSGGGELGARMRAIDWSQTPLGPVERWPQSLRTCVRIILTSRQPMFVWWGEDLINLYNDAYISILGGKHPWALGRPAAEVWREIWHEIAPRATQAMRDNQGTFDEALLLIMERNGYREETYYTFSYSPVPGDRGGPGGILCANSSDTLRIFGERQQALLREVSTRMLDARTIEDAYQRIARALATSPRDLPFALLYAADGSSARLVATAGIAADHPLVQPVIEGDAADAWPVLEVVRTGARAARPLAGQPDLPCGAWNEPPSDAIGLPIRGSDRAVAGVLVVGRNPFRLLDDDYLRFLELLAVQIGNAIANAHAYEAERQRAEALAELDRAKTAFFSNISHEFRTPLTLMIGPTEDALRSEPRALTGEGLAAVHRNELRLLKLVNALLDFSRIEAGRLQAHYEPTDLAQLTRELAASFRSAFARAGLSFDVACDELAGPVRVDRSMWEKIVLNLLSNALKFTFTGGVSLRLVESPGFPGARSTAQRCGELIERGAGIELIVADTGTGIPAGELPRLFERFHRVEGARARTHEGSGIGLALTSELVKLHRGTIDVESELGLGTRFTVRIPRPAAESREPVRPARTPAPFDRQTSSPGIAAFVGEALRWLPDDGAAPGEPAPAPAGSAAAHILVADDNADMRDYLHRLLGERWQVTMVSDGEQALRAAGKHRPDLILTDVMMPNLDGFGLLRALRADAALATIPVVMLSARAGEEARIEGIQAGADDYLIKPFSARELIARVTNMLQLAQLRRDAELERDRLAAYVQQTPAAVAIWDGAELRCRLINDAHTRLYRRRIALGARLIDALPELAAVRPSFEAVLHDGAAIDLPETRLVLTEQDGSVHDGYYNLVFRPLRDRGEVTGVIAITVDVTDQVAARHAIEHSRAAAESANRAKDEFLAMLGHELRNPLAPILTALELMRLRGSDNLARERAVIERQTLHLAALVDDLLDVSRITRGMVQLKRERLALADLIAKAIETSAPLFEQQRHELITDVPRAIAVDADPARLTQVFANLLTNAAKYTDPGGRVTITAAIDGDEVVVAFSDTGRGISADMLPRVFELFVQEHQNLDRSRGGLGLGLSIVRSLISLHGGRVEAASPGPGLGSTFTVRLPRVDGAAVASAPDTASTEAPHERGISVLVVDDNVDAATLLAELLAAHGYVTRVAHDAPQVLALANDFVPDVALLDIGLPAMDGYELARRLRALPHWHNVRLLAVTGYGQRSDRNQSQQAGFDHHLVKPIDIIMLQSLLPAVPRA